MSSERERPPRRRTEEPAGAEMRSYPVDEDALLAAMTDIPFYPPYLPDAMHMHNCMEIGLCLAGEGMLHLGREQTFAFSPGALVLVPQGVPHNQMHAGVPLTHWRYIALNEDYLLRRMPRRYQSELAPLLGGAARGGIFLPGGGEARAEELIGALGIAHLAGRRADRLSGGELARMALARVLMVPRRLLILDEPTAAMDMESTALAEELLLRTCRETGCALLLVTHSLPQARRLADEALFFHRGALWEAGPASRVLHRPERPETAQFLAFYGG